MPTHKKGSAIGIRTLSRATILTTIHLTYLSIQYPSSSMSCQTFEWYIIHWKAVRFGSMITSRAVIDHFRDAVRHRSRSKRSLAQSPDRNYTGAGEYMADKTDTSR